MSNTSASGQAKLPGDELRDYSAELLRARYQRVTVEQREDGKKADAFFEQEDFGKLQRCYVEAKDYASPLRRSQVVAIWADYSGILDRHKPSTLLLVTRKGLTPDARKFVEDEQSSMRHQTIEELENSCIGMNEYIRFLEGVFENNRLSEYYIPGRSHLVTYTDERKRKVSEDTVDLNRHIRSWLNDQNDYSPIAILGGYGAGKSSFAAKIVSELAREALRNPAARKPVLVRLGALTRYSSLDGLLGAMFTNEFPLPAFSYRTFETLNRRGRFLIVLDGFDEMKHAMSWADFRNQIKDLSALIEGDAKVLLLGRPTAFLSFEEHLHVLRGIRRIGDQWRQDFDWPQFQELDLADFDKPERKEFIKKYLVMRSKASRGDRPSAAELKARIVETRKIMLSSEELFAKPVHLKILCDLAANYTIELDEFFPNSSRWMLYQVFLEDLLVRESEKVARSEIAPKVRKTFLQELAFWLWSEKGGQISFQAQSIPEEIMKGLSGISEDDPEILARELLVGSFLEKKQGDTFYFGHRSFAEFLVAQRIIEVLPRGKSVADYSNLASEGVRAFLDDVQEVEPFKQLSVALSGARGEVMLDFISFLVRKVGGKDAFLGLVGDDSEVSSILRHVIYDEDEDAAGADRLFERLYAGLRDFDDAVFFALFDLIVRASKQNLLRANRFAAKILAALLERVFLGASVDTEARKSFVPPHYDQARRLADRCIGDMVNRIDGPHLELRWSELFAEHARFLREDPFRVGVRREDEQTIFSPKVSVPLNSVLTELQYGARDAVSAHLKVSGKMSGVFTRSAKKRKSVRK